MDIRFPAASLILLLAALAGCGGGSSADQAIADVNKTNLHRLSNLYVRFQTEHRWNGPPDEATFREYIQQLSPTVLQRMGVDANETDGLFFSSVDQAPFKIRYGVRGNARGSNEAIVFEADGKQGVRRVGFTSMKVEEIEDDARYQGLLDGTLTEPLQSPQSAPAGR